MSVGADPSADSTGGNRKGAEMEGSFLFTRLKILVRHLVDH